MRIVFMGTPIMSAQILEELAQHHDVVGVFTRPDAVRGRGKKLVASPVKERACALGLTVHTPDTLRDEAVIDLMRSIAPDAVCVVAYGALLPKELLDVPRFGCINVHASLLPRWRGAAPMQRAILAGDAQTGVSIMRMEEGLDTGPFCLQASVETDAMNLGDLEASLASIGAESLIQALDQMERGEVAWTKQPDEGVTYADKIEKAELMLDPALAAAQNLARVRASSDAHPARVQVCGKPLTVLRAHIADDVQSGEAAGALEPGRAVFAFKRLLLRAGDQVLELDAVKPDGKKGMDAKSFAAGLQGIKGKVFSWERL